MKRTLRAFSALLGYPSEALKEHIGDIRTAVVAEAVLPAHVATALEDLLAFLEAAEVIDAQAAYSELFDGSRALSLHIFEHVHGDSRERGPAMVDLAKEYADHGFVMTAEELPDFVPLFLEYASCLPPEDARSWLEQPAHVFAALAERLDARGSAYAAIFQGLIALPRVKPDKNAVAELTAQIAAQEAEAIDAAWEDTAVTFGAPVEQSPTGVIAKIRAARRAVRPNA